MCITFWMKGRCTYSSTSQYHRYGGRGIQVCDEWKDSFETFYADMGDPPSEKHTIERKNVNGNYTPENCVWATKKEQHRNRSDTAYLTLNGVTKPRIVWAEELGIHKDTIRSRINSGMSVEEALQKGKPCMK